MPKIWVKQTWYYNIIITDIIALGSFDLCADSEGILEMPIYPNTDKIEEKMHVWYEGKKSFYSRWSSYVQKKIFFGKSFFYLTLCVFITAVYSV